MISSALYFLLGISDLLLFEAQILTLNLDQFHQARSLATALIVAVITSFALWYKIRAQKLATLRLQKIVNQLSNVQSEIDQFARLSMNGCRVMPRPIQINFEPNQFKAFRSILMEKVPNLDASDSEIEQAIIKSMINFSIEETAKVIVQKLPASLATISETDLAVIYLEIWRNDFRYVSNFIEAIKYKAPQLSLTKNGFERVLKRVFGERIQETRIQILKTSLESGTSGLPIITLDHVDSLTRNGHEFERLLQALFQEMGYTASVTKGSGDQGADLILERFGERIAVQAKCYSDAVSNKAVQEVAAAMAYYKCTRGMVVTNSTFTKSAHELAQANGIELWDRNRLTELLNQFPIPSQKLSVG